MAINLVTNPEIDGRIEAPDANYPGGSSKNDTTGTAGDGTPYKKGRANDIFGLQQALLVAASIVPSGNADTALVSEYMQAIVEVAQGRATLVVEDGASAADAYVLVAAANQQKARSLFDNQELVFDVLLANNSTGGAATLVVFGLAAKPLKLADGTDPKAADISGRMRVRYHLASDTFMVVYEHSAKIEGTNFLINGDRSVDQRGALSNNYGVDRCFISNAGATQQQIRLPVADSITTGCVFAQEITQVNAADFHEQRIERSQYFLGLQVNYGQWIKAASNVTLTIEEVWFVNGITTITNRGTIDVTTSFQPLDLAILMRDDITGFGINPDDFVSFRVSGYGATKVTVTGEQSKKGLSFDEFEYVSSADSLALCQRYGWAASGAVVFIAGARKLNAAGSGAVTAASFSTSFLLPVMRLAPVIENVIGSAVTLNSESGGLLATCNAVPVVVSNGLGDLSCSFGSADVTDVTQMRFTSTLPFFSAEL